MRSLFTNRKQIRPNILSHCDTAALSQSRHQQQPPPGPEPVRGHDGGGGGCEAVAAGVDVDVDLLSSLHDDVLGSIITLLPTKDGARTQILSRRWRPLWRSASAPLNFEATVAATSAAVDPRPTPPRPSAAVVGALQAHPDPARRVSLTWLGQFHDFPMVDGLMSHRRRSPCLDGLRQFELYYKPVNVPGGRRHPPPMASLLRFARTLRVLTICSAACCYSYNPYRLVFPAETETDAAGRALEFPNLEQLTLKHVSFSDAALHAVLSACPALQSLVLHKNEGYGRLVIRSPTLRSLGVSDGAEVVVEDAPMLERLIPRELWHWDICLTKSLNLRWEPRFSIAVPGHISYALGSLAFRSIKCLCYTLLYAMLLACCTHKISLNFYLFVSGNGTRCWRI
ncbi:putative F-box/LRR-repeat protein At3g58880 [Miscanthus floridulus]|uniref:putative F-box/LRR-repeat protein At3g58880 n=1 Tax=Miscanthus floridulus TaxID=154761 RepID=UPI0034596C08